MNKKRYMQLKAKGICVDCRKTPARPGKTRCGACAQKGSVKTQQKYWNLVSQGVCVQCHQAPARPDRVCCESCAETASRKEKRRRDRLRTQGLCASCGKTNPLPGQVHCKICAEMFRISSNERYHLLKAQGLCAQCGKVQAVLGKVLCKTCARAFAKRERLRKFDGNHRHAVERDGGMCRLCGHTARLCVHHIDGQGDTSPDPNHSLDNLITLCRFCHGSLTRLRRLSSEGRQGAAKLLLA